MPLNNLTIRLPMKIKLLSVRDIMRLCKTLMKRYRVAKMVARQRQQLSQLDSDQLKDIGISRSDAITESSREFWDIPEHLK